MYVALTTSQREKVRSIFNCTSQILLVAKFVSPEKSFFYYNMMIKILLENSRIFLHQALCDVELRREFYDDGGEIPLVELYNSYIENPDLVSQLESYLTLFYQKILFLKNPVNNDASLLQKILELLLETKRHQLEHARVFDNTRVLYIDFVSDILGQIANLNIEPLQSYLSKGKSDEESEYCGIIILQHLLKEAGISFEDIKNFVQSKILNEETLKAIEKNHLIQEYLEKYSGLSHEDRFKKQEQVFAKKIQEFLPVLNHSNFPNTEQKIDQYHAAFQVCKASLFQRKIESGEYSENNTLKVIALTKGNEIKTEWLREAVTFNPIHALVGYESILKGFSYSECLQDSQKNEIDSMIKALQQLQDNQLYRQKVLEKSMIINSNHIILSPEAKAREWMKIFRIDHALYFSTATFSIKEGDFGHACFCKFYKKENRYYRSDYDAANSTEPMAPQNVLTVNTREVLCKDDEEAHERILHMLTATLQRQLENSGNAFDNERKLISQYCSETREELSCRSSPQGKENCTSRSVREILRGNLSPELFQKLQNYLNEKTPEEIENDQRSYEEVSSLKFAL